MGNKAMTADAWSDPLQEAQNEIDRLRAENARLRHENNATRISLLALSEQIRVIDMIVHNALTDGKP